MKHKPDNIFLYFDHFDACLLRALAVAFAFSFSCMATLPSSLKKCRRIKKTLFCSYILGIFFVVYLSFTYMVVSVAY